MTKFDWRHFAQKEPGWWDPPTPQDFQRLQLEAIQKLLTQAHPIRVLEIGVGRGRATTWLRGSWIYVGIEVNGPLLRFAKEQGVAPRVIGTGTDLPFRDGAFGAIVAYDVLMHIWGRHGFFNECHRVLAPRGVFIANYMRRYSPGWRRYVLARVIRPRKMRGSNDRRFDLTNRLEAFVSTRGFRPEFLMRTTSCPILVAEKIAKSSFDATTPSELLS